MLTDFKIRRRMEACTKLRMSESQVNDLFIIGKNISNADILRIEWKLDFYEREFHQVLTPDLGNQKLLMAREEFFAAKCLLSENFSIKLGLERLRFNFVSDHSKLCHLRSTIKPLKYLWTSRWELLLRSSWWLENRRKSRNWPTRYVTFN